MTRENMDNLEIILINFPNMATIVFNPTVDDVSSERNTRDAMLTLVEVSPQYGKCAALINSGGIIHYTVDSTRYRQSLVLSSCVSSQHN